MDLWRDKGYTAYVCGTSSQTLDYTLELFIRALENQKPKVVILETDAIYREVPSQKAIFTRLANHLAVFRYHNRWKTLSWNDFLGETHFTWTDDWKGYRYYATISGTNPGEYMKPVETAAEIPERNIRYVKEIQRLCQGERRPSGVPQRTQPGELELCPPQRHPGSGPGDGVRVPGFEPKAGSDPH